MYRDAWTTSIGNLIGDAGLGSTAPEELLLLFRV